MSVPIDKDNRHYQEIQWNKCKDGTLTIKDAE